MTGPNDTLDDEAYDSLIAELGLDLDLDLDDAAHSQSDDEALDEEPVFTIRDTDASSFRSASETEAPDGGVELSASLLAELRSVIGGGAPEETTEKDAADFAGADIAYVEDPIQLSGSGRRDDEDLDISDFPAFGEILAPPEVSEASEVSEVSDTATEEVSEADEASDLTTADRVDDIVLGAFGDILNDVERDERNAATLYEDETGDEPFSAELARRDKPDFANTDLDDFGADDESSAISQEVGADDDYADAEPAAEASQDVAEPEIARDSLTEATRASLSDLDFEADNVWSSEPALNNRVEREELDFGGLDEDAFDAPPAPSSEEDESYGKSGAFSPTKLDLDSLEQALNRGQPSDEQELPPIEIDEPEADELSAEEVVYGEEDVGFELSYLNDMGGDRVVPRITIHAFCQTASASRLMKTAKKDRRMINVSMQVIEGGVAAAIDFYAEQAMPHLMIVESTANAARLLAELDTLAERCDENVKVMVIGAANDIRLYRELMRRGVSEYLVPPIETVQLIRAISSQFSDPEQPFTGKTVAVTGVKGGVGASTIAHNLAYSLAERIQIGTTLVDLDLNFGTTGLDFNNETTQSIADALLAPDRFDEAVLGRLVIQATEHLSLFTAPSSLERTFDLDSETYENVLAQVRASVPYVVLDMPHIWSDWFKDTLMSADEIVIVAQPDLASLRNGKNMIDYLKAARPNDELPRLVVNNVGVPKRPEIPVKDFAQAIGLEASLVLPFDPQLFGTAANNGQMIADVAPDSKCSQGVDFLASLMSGRDVKVERTSLLDRLLKR